MCLTANMHLINRVYGSTVYVCSYTILHFLNFLQNFQDKIKTLKYLKTSNLKIFQLHNI